MPRRRCTSRASRCGRPTPHVDIKHAINLVADELARQVKRHRDKRRKRREQRAAAARCRPSRRAGPGRAGHAARRLKRTPSGGQGAAAALSLESHDAPRSRPPDGRGQAVQALRQARRAPSTPGSPSWSCSTTRSCASSADALRERAADGESLDDLLAETFALVREVGRRAHGHAPLRRPADRRHGAAQRRDRRDAHRRGQDADRHAAVVLNALAGKGVHVVTVNDYLARRDAEWMTPDLRGPRAHLGRAAEHAALRGEARRLRRRHHVRHQLRVRLRLPARQHGHVAGGEGPARRPRRRGRQADRHAPLRDRRRGRQHPHRRGAHPADHLRRPRAGRRPLRRVRQARAADGAGQEAGGHGPEVQEGLHRRLRLRVRREAQDRLGHRAAASPRPRTSSASTTSTRPRTARWSTTSTRR